MLIVARTKYFIIKSVLLHGTPATKQSLFNSIKKTCPPSWNMIACHSCHETLPSLFMSYSLNASSA
jgi:hypothetical protein